jgi:hypothetical protein
MLIEYIIFFMKMLHKIEDKQNEHSRLYHFFLSIYKSDLLVAHIVRRLQNYFPCPSAKQNPSPIYILFVKYYMENGTFKFSPSSSHHLKASSNFIQLGVLLHIFIYWAYECIKVCSQVQSKHLLHFGPKQ